MGERSERCVRWIKLHTGVEYERNLTSSRSSSEQSNNTRLRFLARASSASALSVYRVNVVICHCRKVHGPERPVQFPFISITS